MREWSFNPFTRIAQWPTLWAAKLAVQWAVINGVWTDIIYHEWVR